MAGGFLKTVCWTLWAQVDSSYAGRHDHSTVVRWESGAIYPTRERLEVFGRALALSPTEIDGLISLAGIDADAITSKAAETQDLGRTGQLLRSGPHKCTRRTKSGHDHSGIRW